MSNAGNASSASNGSSTGGGSASNSAGGSAGDAMQQVTCHLKGLRGCVSCIVRGGPEGGYAWGEVAGGCVSMVSWSRVLYGGKRGRGRLRKGAVGFGSA